MKTMTCNQLGGACNKEFHANTFDEIAEMSKNHGTEKFQTGDEQHLKAMNKMMELMKSPYAMNDWFESKRKELESLPECNKDAPEKLKTVLRFKVEKQEK